MGKSRLVYEVVHRIARRAGVLESASVSYGKATPYFPVIDLLKRYAQIEDTDAPHPAGPGHGAGADAGRGPPGHLPPLLALLDALPEDSPFRQLEPPQRRQRTLAALKRLLLRESQEQPLLLVFEDLHWIDTETQALLDSLVESLPTARLLPGQLPARVPARLGQQDVLHATAARSRCHPPALTSSSRPSGNDPSLAASNGCSSNAPRATPSSWRRVCAPWWRPGC